jgi:hypothetical protein
MTGCLQFLLAWFCLSVVAALVFRLLLAPREPGE